MTRKMTENKSVERMEGVVAEEKMELLEDELLLVELPKKDEAKQKELKWSIPEWKKEREDIREWVERVWDLAFNSRTSEAELGSGLAKFFLASSKWEPWFKATIPRENWRDARFIVNRLVEAHSREEDRITRLEERLEEERQRREEDFVDFVSRVVMIGEKLGRNEEDMVRVIKRGALPHIGHKLRKEKVRTLAQTKVVGREKEENERLKLRRGDGGQERGVWWAELEEREKERRKEMKELVAMVGEMARTIRSLKLEKEKENTYMVQPQVSYLTATSSQGPAETRMISSPQRMQGQPRRYIHPVTKGEVRWEEYLDQQGARLCFGCKKVGHLFRECPEQKARREQLN